MGFGSGCFDGLLDVVSFLDKFNGCCFFMNHHTPDRVSGIPNTPGKSDLCY